MRQLKSFIWGVIGAAVCGAATPVSGQVPPAAGYDVVAIGLTGGDYYVSNKGTVLYSNGLGQVAGMTQAQAPGSGSYRGQDPWLFDGRTSRRIGPSGPSYQRSNGVRWHEIFDMTASGILGSSHRYLADMDAGIDVWIDDGTTLRFVGLTGPGYESTMGFRESHVFPLIADSGLIAGTSNRYSVNGAPRAGADPWLSDGETTWLVHLPDAVYESSVGRRGATIGLTRSGVVYGSQDRFEGEGVVGRDVWISAGPNTGGVVNLVLMGLMGAGYEEGLARDSSIFGVTESGMAAGTSVRLGTGRSGQDAWFFDGVSTQRIGLTGPEYEGADGHHDSRPVAVVDGFVVGVTDRSDASGGGVDAWLFDGVETRRIGLEGAPYIATSGMRIAFVQDLDANGRVIGRSNVYDGDTRVTSMLWLFDGMSTLRLSPTEPIYERADGARSESAVFDAFGRIYGSSTRYHGSASVGRDAWVIRNGQRQLLGLSGAAFEGPDNARRSTFRASNAHVILGVSTRYGASYGQSGWLYDDSADATMELLPAAAGAYMSPETITETDVVVGLHWLDGTTLPERRLFWWSPETGFIDMTSLAPELGQFHHYLRVTGVFAVDGNGVPTAIGIEHAGPVQAWETYLLLPACAADLTDDRAVDVFDLLDYLDLWFSADTAAEWTGDEPAAIDVHDLLEFLDAWFAGC